MRSPQVNGSIMGREWKPQDLTVGTQAATHHGLKILQQCWKGSEGAVSKASNREDSNPSAHLSFFLSAKHHLRVLACKSSANSPAQGRLCFKQSSAYLQQQWPGFMWWLMAALSWSRSLGCPQPSHVLSAWSLPGTQHLLTVTLVTCTGFSSVH